MPSLHLRLIVLGLLLSSAFAADPAWLGAWQDEVNPDDLMLFERDRLVVKNPGQDPIFACAVYSADGEVWARAGGSRVRLKVTVAGDRLQLVAGGTGTYRRLASAPPALQLVAQEIPAAKAVAPKRLKEIKEETDRRVKQDQAVRVDPGKQAQMGTVDADNTAWIKAIIAEAGWPDAKRFGKEVSSSMFLFVQHSGDLRLMLGVLPCIEQDLKAGACDPQDFALLFDRVQMMSGRPQRYGSQIVPDTKGQTVYLLEDRAKVEALRAAIGLFPLRAYVQIFEQQTGSKLGFMEQVRFDD